MFGEGFSTPFEVIELVLVITKVTSRKRGADAYVRVLPPCPTRFTLELAEDRFWPFAFSNSNMLPN